MSGAGPMIVATALLAAACTGPASPPAPRPAPTTVEVDRPGAAPRPGMPTVPDRDPLFTTATTVLDTGRPAVVVTFPEAVLFAFGSADLRPDAEPALQAAADLLRRHPDAAVEVAGHTDAVGPAEFNRALSQQRAAAVVAWLVAHGIPRSQLRPVGYGATRPVAANDTDDERRRNRRVELTVAT